jgi:hypothetical protein
MSLLRRWAQNGDQEMPNERGELRRFLWGEFNVQAVAIHPGRAVFVNLKAYEVTHRLRSLSATRNPCRTLCPQ